MATRRRSLEERFWLYVDLREWESGDCWGWSSTVDRDGYPWIYSNATRRYLRAHRFSFELHNGQISTGLVVCHKCDNPTCANPAHLFLGTTRDNNQDMAAKGRSARGSRNVNAKLTASDVRAIRTSDAAAPALAKRFDVTLQTIHHVRKRITWKHIA